MKVIPSHRLLGLAAVFLFALMLVGCGGPSGPTLAKCTGTVKYKGQPVSGANVSFLFDKGEVASGVTDDMGKFNLTTSGREGAPLGKAKVVITKMTGGSAPSMPTNPTPGDMKKMMEQGGPKQPEPPKNELPAKYSSKESTNLEAEVGSGQPNPNEFLFELAD